MVNAALRRRPLLGFFILAFVIAWVVWIPAGLLAPELFFLILPGAWAPTVAALWVTAAMQGKSGVKDLLRALLKWRVGWRFYLFAIFAVLGLGVAAVTMHVLLGGAPPDLADIAGQFGLPPEQATLFFAIAPVVFISSIFAGGPIAEELGWRGFAQPLLQHRIGVAWAGLAIGFIWSLWHLPMFMFFPAAVGGIPLVYYIPLMSMMGVLFAWLYHGSGGSVLLCVLFHAGINFTLGNVGAQFLAENHQAIVILIVLTAVFAVVLGRRKKVPR